jgi:hypothetical protein
MQPHILSKDSANQSIVTFYNVIIYISLNLLIIFGMTASNGGIISHKCPLRGPIHLIETNRHKIETPTKD